MKEYIIIILTRVYPKVSGLSW